MKQNKNMEKAFTGMEYYKAIKTLLEVFFLQVSGGWERQKERKELKEYDLPNIQGKDPTLWQDGWVGGGVQGDMATHKSLHLESYLSI